jgi:hypothetical protein
MMRFSGPTSVCQKAASGDNLVRAGKAWPKRSSACGDRAGLQSVSAKFDDHRGFLRVDGGETLDPSPGKSSAV